MGRFLSIDAVPITGFRFRSAISPCAEMPNFRCDLPRHRSRFLDNCRVHSALAYSRHQLLRLGNGRGLDCG